MKVEITLIMESFTDKGKNAVQEAFDEIKSGNFVKEVNQELDEEGNIVTNPNNRMTVKECKIIQ